MSDHTNHNVLPLYSIRSNFFILVGAVHLQLVDLFLRIGVGAALRVHQQIQHMLLLSHQHGLNVLVVRHALHEVAQLELQVQVLSDIAGTLLPGNNRSFPAQRSAHLHRSTNP